MNKEIYETLWETGWEDARHYGPIARHSRRIINEMIKDLNIASVLDVGCGECSLLNTIFQNHCPSSISGIDISNKALKICQNLFPNGSFYKLDITKDKLEENFDLIISADVIEHLDNDQAAIKNMSAMLNPSGRLIISTLLGEMREVERQVGHLRNYSKKDLLKKINNAGLQIEHVTTWGWPFFSPFYRNLLNLIGNKGTMGKFGLIRKMICNILYYIFYFNSSSKGDYIFIRAKRI
ncbi:MAG: class I SAM-dependent methyltransferase [Pseudomonadota bacterium]|nr:class I SAM-dependent methyltransferase [Pseudomonadota bacterium]